MTEETPKRCFLKNIGIPYPANDGSSDSRKYDRGSGVDLATIARELRAALHALDRQEPVVVRDAWVDVLMTKLVSSNPYREPMDERAVYADMRFLETLLSRVERLLEEYSKAWARQPRSFDETGHF